MQNVLAPVASPRTGIFESYGKKSHLTLLLTTYCPMGTPLAHANINPTPEARIAQAIIIYEQMCQILMLIEKENYFFPDAKNANWLVDDQFNLRIADTKSLVFAPDKIYDENKTGSLTEPGLVYTKGFVSPEMRTHDRPFSVTVAHSYLLGKNIEEFLTKKLPWSSFESSFQGIKLKSMVERLTKSSAEKRMSLKEAMTTLQTLKNEKFCYCNQLLLDFHNNYSYIDEDDAMNSWMMDKYEQLISLSSDQDYEDFSQQIIQITKENKLIINLLWDMLKEEMSQSGNFHQVALKEVAVRDAFYKIPPPERIKIIDNKYFSSQIDDLRKVLGTIPTNHTAQFQKYKEQIGALKEQQVENNIQPTQKGR